MPTPMTQQRDIFSTCSIKHRTERSVVECEVLDKATHLYELREGSTYYIVKDLYSKIIYRLEVSSN